MLDDPALDRLARDVRDAVATRGIHALLLIDDQGRPYLIPWGEPVDAEEAAAAADLIVEAYDYTFGIRCYACKTSGPHAGERKCCVVINGNEQCGWERC